MSCLTGPAGAHPPGRKGSTIMANEDRSIGGIDSHLDTIHVAVIAANGREVDDQEFPTTTSGYRRAVAWLAEHGPLRAVGVEGTSSYGLGICAALTDAGIKVVEVNRTRPAERRRQGKTDQLDAYRAARSVLSGEATTDPKSASIEPLRALQVARRSAVKSQQAAGRQLGALLVNAPVRLRDRYRDLKVPKLVAALANTRPGQVGDPDDADVLAALRSLAPSPSGPRRGDQLAPGPHGRPCHRRKSGAAIHQGCRSGARRSAADYRRRQPRTVALVVVLRRSVRHRAHPGQLRTYRPPPPVPGR